MAGFRAGHDGGCDGVPAARHPSIATCCRDNAPTKRDDPCVLTVSLQRSIMNLDASEMDCRMEADVSIRQLADPSVSG
jgi:hypothetical protein